jgi:hypothetical protein
VKWCHLQSGTAFTTILHFVYSLSLLEIQYIRISLYNVNSGTPNGRVIVDTIANYSHELSGSITAANFEKLSLWTLSIIQYSKKTQCFVNWIYFCTQVEWCGGTYSVGLIRNSQFQSLDQWFWSLTEPFRTE